MVYTMTNATYHGVSRTNGETDMQATSTKRSSVVLPDLVKDAARDLFKATKDCRSPQIKIGPTEIVISTGFLCLSIPAQQTSSDRHNYETILPEYLRHDPVEKHDIFLGRVRFELPEMPYLEAYALATQRRQDAITAQKRAATYLEGHSDPSPLCIGAKQFAECCAAIGPTALLTPDALDHLFAPMLKIKDATRKLYGLDNFRLMASPYAVSLTMYSDDADFTSCADSAISRNGMGTWTVGFSMDSTSIFHCILDVFGESGAYVTMAPNTTTKDASILQLRNTAGWALYMSVIDKTHKEQKAHD